MQSLNSYLQQITKDGSWESVDISTITAETINLVAYGAGSMKTNLIGLAAQHKKLDKFPQNLINKEGLISPNESGETPMHFIASSENSQLDYIPLTMMNEELLLLPNNDGTTPFHYIAYHGNLQKLGKDYLISKNLELTNKNGLTSLDYAIFDLNELSLPLMRKNSAMNKRNIRIESQVRFIVSKLSTNFLKAQLKLPANSKFYAKKAKVIKPELTKREVLKDISNPNQCLEI